MEEVRLVILVALGGLIWWELNRLVAERKECNSTLKKSTPDPEELVDMENRNYKARLIESKLMNMKWLYSVKYGGRAEFYGEEETERAEALDRITQLTEEFNNLT